MEMECCMFPLESRSANEDSPELGRINRYFYDGTDDDNPIRICYHSYNERGVLATNL